MDGVGVLPELEGDARKPDEDFPGLLEELVRLVGSLGRSLGSPEVGLGVMEKPGERAPGAGLRGIDRDGGLKILLRRLQQGGGLCRVGGLPKDAVAQRSPQLQGLRIPGIQGQRPLRMLQRSLNPALVKSAGELAPQACLVPGHPAAHDDRLDPGRIQGLGQRQQGIRPLQHL